MKNLFEFRWFRALYQILVVGIILLPLRLVIGVSGALMVFTVPVDGVSLSEGFSLYFANIVLAYEKRIHWVKTGEKLY